MLQNLLENYGWLPISLAFGFIAHIYLDLTVSLSAGIVLATMLLSNSLLRFRLRKSDPRRFIFGLVAGISVLFLVVSVHLNYIEMRQYLIIVAFVPAFVTDYFLSKKYADLYE